ncbi:MAG: tetratricopeptide repeat protein, partial [Chloroflexota bacterium]
LFDTQRTGNGHLIELQRWRAEDVAALVVASENATDLPENISERLYDETEGLPYLVVEYLNVLKTGAADDWTMPQTVHDLLTGRLADLDQTALQLLQTAAVIGRSFDYDNLWNASGRSEEEVVTGLGQLLARGLIREAPGTDGYALCYDFSHQQLRSVVYEGVHLARRRLLHRRIATALAVHSNTAPAGSIASQIGYHYHAAGQDNLAAEQYCLAGEFAQSLYANREALGHYETALALGYPSTVELNEAIGDLHTLLGEYNAALHAYESAAARADEVALAQLEHKLGQVYERRGDWELAESHLCAALEAGRPDQAARRALINVDRSRVAHRSGDPDTATDLATEALSLAEASGDRLAEALAHNALGILARQQGNPKEARDHLTRSLALAEEIGSESARIAALNNLARLHAELDDTAAALDLLEQALQLCRQRGDRHHEAALLNHRADVLHQAGQENEAMSSLKEAVAIYAEIGLEAGDWQPEIWKLTEW